MMMFGDFDKYLEEIKEEYHAQVERADYAYKKMQEWNKDDKIQELKQKKDWIYTHCLCPNLSDKEIQDIKDFQNKHYISCCGNGKYKSKGNTWRYEITGTGIGSIIKIQCPECQEWLDVTDLDNW